MNSKLKKSLNIVAVAIFIFGLAINIQMSLDDPFSRVNAVALAQETGTGCNGNYTRSVRNYDLVITPEYRERKYDEEDCTKKWTEYYTLSGWCCFYD